LSLEFPVPAWRAALGVLAVTSAIGCTWLVDSSAAQCRTDGDCARYGATTCDQAAQVCMPRSGGTPDGGAGDAPGCRVADGCRACAAGQTPGLANACTNTTCVPFDPSRVTHMGPDGGLRSLPAVSQ
jgi:hypothetical protein